jgi:putative ATPase
MARSTTRNLFDEGELEQRAQRFAPLPERLRPRSLSEFTGQNHLVGEGRILRRLIEGGGTLPSLILWGAPGTGKTTLARLLADKSGALFVPMSAVFSGVKDLRDAIAEAKREAKFAPHCPVHRRIHRFNKGQQDALLHAVEDGTVTLVGATTENPSFEVTGALLSRCRVLFSIRSAQMKSKLFCKGRSLMKNAGLANLHAVVSDELLERLAHSAGGDARVALAALEAAVESTEPGETAVRALPTKPSLRPWAALVTPTTRAVKNTTTWHPHRSLAQLRR